MAEVIENASRVEIEFDQAALRTEGVKSIYDLATDTRHNVLLTIQEQTAVLTGNGNLTVKPKVFRHVQVKNELGEVIMSPRHAIIKTVKVDGIEIWKK